MNDVLVIKTNPTFIKIKKSALIILEISLLLTKINVCYKCWDCGVKRLVLLFDGAFKLNKSVKHDCKNYSKDTTEFVCMSFLLYFLHVASHGLQTRESL